MCVKPMLCSIDAEVLSPMSVMFGRCHFGGPPPDPEDIGKARALLAPFAPDGEHSMIRDHLVLFFGSFHTTCPRNEVQPWVSPSGCIWMWDGRLDNRDELARLLFPPPVHDPPDVAIVAAAYDRWGSSCFSQLLGDWALSVWDPANASVLLARDFLGGRPLYYLIRKDELIWSTVLDAVIAAARDSFALSERYLAGWFSHFPDAHLSPYDGIRVVPPGCWVRVSNRKTITKQHWDFSSSKEIRYRSDAEYEDHFRTVFAQSVKRRLASHLPVAAELSGGMDSSGIVCMADDVLSHDTSLAPALYTISYYNEAEPSWQEHAYFAHVEQRRGIIGCHIDIREQNIFEVENSAPSFQALPFSSRRNHPVAQRFADCLRSYNARVLLSGIGGDEVLGAVPNPVPELAGLMVRGQWGLAWKQLIAWALVLKKPVPQLLKEMFRSFLWPQACPTVSFWLRQDFQKRHREVLERRAHSFRIFDARPVFHDNLHTLDFLKRQIAGSGLARCPLYEKRYPYLDRDLLEFLFAIPPEQLQRPEERRSLMRRSLKGIVPDEVLNRRRKAYIARSPTLDLAASLPALHRRTDDLCQAMQRMIDSAALHQALDRAAQGDAVLLIPLLRTFALDARLKELKRSGFWNGRIAET
jgi:asparagine synthase (glutamine-hydrolysing)